MFNNMQMSEFFKIIRVKAQLFSQRNIDKNLKLLLEICELFCTN